MPSALEQRTTRRVETGSFYPLGASARPGGVNFALYSRAATGVFLLLFSEPDGDPTDVIPLVDRTRFVWNAFVRDVRPGQLYGYKVCGPFDPALGLRFNETKLLIDPYARALSHKPLDRDHLLLAYDPGAVGRDLTLDTRENNRLVPKAIVVDDAFEWQGDAPPHIPFEDLVIYEVHAKGFTAHPSSNVSRPGTYLGFVEKIPHLRSLGINAVELLPVHEHLDDAFLVEKGLTNYWGYNTLGFFAPESSYGSRTAPGVEVTEFKTLVRELHRAGIEVILDVVYNHTAEGSELGPTLSFRGIDNPTYYMLTGPPDQPGRYYLNPTGCGNALDLTRPAVLRLVMDSLRYWVEVMHVDGFRFDLASVLGREDGAFRVSSPFFDAVGQDPVLCRAKLIAEPWDLGTYQVGHFPVDWSEWNGRFRDAVRRFVKGDGGQVREIGSRLTGSSDLYGDDGRSPYNSVNFATCHDGFTLHDLVSYNGKHNEANLEDNRDGTDDNLSWNCGVEGETGDPEIVRLRRQQAKNFVCHVLFSAGTPMLLGGDEMFRTQRGNNNAYCQDNDLSWFDWRDAERNGDLLAFVRRTIAFRKRYPALRRRAFYAGLDLDHDGAPDIGWYGPQGGPPAWNDPEARTVCFELDGGESPSDLGDYRLFLVLNADWRPVAVRLPELPPGRRWARAVDTGLAPGDDFRDPGTEVPVPGPDYAAAPRSTVVLIG